MNCHSPVARRGAKRGLDKKRAKANERSERPGMPYPDVRFCPPLAKWKHLFAFDGMVTYT